MGNLLAVVVDAFGMFSKIGLSVADMGSGLMAMAFSKFTLEIWGGRELPAYTLEGS